MSISSLSIHAAAHGCVKMLCGVVENCIVPNITEMTLSRISKRVGITNIPKNRYGTSIIDIHFGEIHDEVTPPDENTIEIFVPYGLPSVGSYTMAAFLNGTAITDKKKNNVDGPQRGFYVTVTINLLDFEGMSYLSKRFHEVWVEKKYEENVRVIALNDTEVLTSKTPYAFASWFSNKLASGYLKWCKLNKEKIKGDESAAEDFIKSEEEKEEVKEVIEEEEVKEDHSSKDDKSCNDDSAIFSTPTKRSATRMPSAPCKKPKGSKIDDDEL